LLFGVLSVAFYLAGADATGLLAGLGVVALLFMVYSASRALLAPLPGYHYVNNTALFS
jgi:hypothetical protein